MRLLIKFILLLAATVGIQKAIDAKVPYEAWFTLRSGLAGLTGDERLAQALALEYTDHLPYRTDPVAAAAARAQNAERMRFEDLLGPDAECLWEAAELESVSCHCPVESEAVHVAAAR